jgi:hypothetical protein
VTGQAPIWIRKLVAGLLNFVAVCVLLLGAFVGPMVLYAHSPWWLLGKFDPDRAGTFFVAFMSSGGGGFQRLHVVRYAAGSGTKGGADVQYHLPEGRQTYKQASGDGGARIDVRTEPSGSQVVQVFVTGDTPWTSLSEYRVAGNQVTPLRHAHSEPWLLLGIVICLYLVHRLMKPVRREIRRLLRIEGEK